MVPYGGPGRDQETCTKRWCVEVWKALHARTLDSAGAGGTKKGINQEDAASTDGSAVEGLEKSRTMHGPWRHEDTRAGRDTRQKAAIPPGHAGTCDHGQEAT